MLNIKKESLTFDDILILPRYSEVLPRDVSLKTALTAKISLNIPLVSAAMDTVTEYKLAIALAQQGGLGIIHKNMPVHEQVYQVKRVKKYESGVVKDPITIHSQASVRELVELTSKHGISGVPVVTKSTVQNAANPASKGRLIGIVTNRDLRFIEKLDDPVSSIMTTKEKLITATADQSLEEIKGLLHKHRIEKIPIVDKAFNLQGMLTARDLSKQLSFPHACKDSQGRLRVGAAVGTGPAGQERIEALIAAETDVLVIDTAHGHSKGVIDQLSWVKRCYPQVQLIAGNIATADAALALADAGADAVKVGIGPGSICTTRIVSGVGVPQISAVDEVSRALAKHNIPVIADGGIRFSGDIAKALVAGAHVVMVGSLFAGTDEAPGEIELFGGRSYKLYRGMGSLGAMEKGSHDRYFQTGIQSEKLVPEGVEGRVPSKGSLSVIVHQLLGGLRSCMGYTGCKDIGSLRNEVECVRITTASITESHVHDVSITREAPNYHV